MAWKDPRATWRRWYKAQRKAQRQVRAINLGRRRYSGGGFWIALVRLVDFRR